MIPEKIIKAFFLGVQVGILVKSNGRWIYHGLVPMIGEPRTMQIMNKHRLDG